MTLMKCHPMLLTPCRWLAGLCLVCCLVCCLGCDSESNAPPAPNGSEAATDSTAETPNPDLMSTKIDSLMAAGKLNGGLGLPPSADSQADSNELEAGQNRTGGVGGPGSSDSQGNATAASLGNNPGPLTAAPSAGASPEGAPQTDGKQTGNDADINRLMARLNELHQMQVDVETMDQFQAIQAERLEKATELLAANPSYEFQVLAIKSQIDALSWQDGTQQPGAKERLTARCEELLASENLEFRRMGLLGLAGGFMRSFFRQPDAALLPPFVEQLRTTLSKNKDDFELATELAQAASSLFAKGHRQEAIQLMTAIREPLRESEELPVVGIVDSLTAQIAMAEVRFDKVIADQVADEDKNLPNLEAAMGRIIETGATVALYNEMIPWMQLFEQQGRYRSADKVAECLETAYRQLPSNPNLVEVLEALQPIRKRMGMVGKPLSWEGLVDYQGNPFDPAAVADKVVLVTFFSAEADKSQREQLQFETRIFEELQNRGFAMVGFNVDNDPNAARNFFAARPPRWQCVRSADVSRLGYASPFAEQVIADRVPYRLLLDRSGNIVHIAIPIERLGRDVSNLMQSSAD